MTTTTKLLGIKKIISEYLLFVYARSSFVEKDCEYHCPKKKRIYLVGVTEKNYTMQHRWPGEGWRTLIGTEKIRKQIDVTFASITGFHHDHMTVLQHIHTQPTTGPCKTHLCNGRRSALAACYGFVCHLHSQMFVVDERPRSLRATRLHVTAKRPKVRVSEQRTQSVARMRAARRFPVRADVRATVQRRRVAVLVRPEELTAHAAVEAFHLTLNAAMRRMVVQVAVAQTALVADAQVERAHRRAARAHLGGRRARTRTRRRAGRRELVAHAERVLGAAVQRPAPAQLSATTSLRRPTLRRR